MAPVRTHHLAVLAITALLAGCAGAPTTPDETPGGTDVASSEQALPGDADEQPTDTPEPTSAEHPTEDAGGHDDHETEPADDHEGEQATGDTEVDRVVAIDMEDVAFSVEELEFSVGDRVRFEFHNVGQAPHEALIGDLHLQDEHDEEMAAGDGHHGDGHHEQMSMISLDAGESGAVVHEFTEPGELWVGCHVPGHWGAGMRTRITVKG